jgi:hypothetical protein
VLSHRREPLPNTVRGQDAGNDPLGNERMVGMNGYSRQDLPVVQDFPTWNCCRIATEREAYLPIAEAIFWLRPVHSVQQLEQH